MTEIRFWSKSDEHSYLSNFHIAPIVLDGRSWKTVEHFFQAQKTFSVNERERIRRAASPSKAKRLGCKVRLRSDWERIKEDIMLQALRAKFNQHSDLTKRLLETGDCKLIKDSPYDRYWGGKLPGSKNRLGVLLMTVRDEIADDKQATENN